MKIRIDQSACVGNARCAAVSPELFPLDEDGLSPSRRSTFPPAWKSWHVDAHACPEKIVVIEEDSAAR